MSTRIGILTGGGDCPGLNAVIRAVVRKGQNTYGDELVGFRDGWRGALEGDVIPLDVEAMRGTLPRGGTVIAVTTQGAPSLGEFLSENDDVIIHVPDSPALLSPIVMVVPLQLLAYSIAVRRGCDVDQPRNLAKSVTVE